MQEAVYLINKIYEKQQDEDDQKQRNKRKKKCNDRLSQCKVMHCHDTYKHHEECISNTDTKYHVVKCSLIKCNELAYKCSEKEAECGRYS